MTGADFWGLAFLTGAVLTGADFGGSAFLAGAVAVLFSGCF
ncbi:MAG: hypothetical protein ACQES9_03940 [Myxococcota bacterium]